MVNVRFAACAVLLFSLSACTSEPPEFADGTRPVPEGTPIIEYAGVPMAETTGRIELVEDLVLGGGDTTEGRVLYRPLHVAIDDTGGIYVLDAGHKKVLVFDSSGSFMNSIGRPGEGPGEFPGPRGLGVVGDRLVVLSSPRRISVWTLDGELVSDHQLEIRGGLLDLFDTQTDLFVASMVLAPDRPPSRDDPYTRQLISAYSLEGEEVVGLTETPRLFRTPETAPFILPTSIYAVSSAGDVYVTDARRYEIAAYNVTGEPKWTLRVGLEPERVTDEEIDEFISSITASSRPVRRGDYVWPEHYPAIAQLFVDGHGHLYVYRFTRRDFGGDLQPVDVYSSTGEHLFSGMITKSRWSAARGDHIYSIETDPDTEEHVVVRYRLVEPF